MKKLAKMAIAVMVCMVAAVFFLLKDEKGKTYGYSSHKKEPGSEAKHA